LEGYPSGKQGANSRQAKWLTISMTIRQSILLSSNINSKFQVTTDYVDNKT